MTTDPSKALERATAEPRPPATMQEYLDEQRQGAFFTTLDTTQEAGQMQVAAAMLGESKSLSEHVGDFIEVQDLLAHPIEVEDTESGELVQLVRWVIIDPQGNRWSCASGGVAKALNLYRRLWGLPPWRPAKRFRIVQVTTSKKRKMLSLEYAPASAEGNGRKPK